jgi:hypothetical protein
MRSDPQPEVDGGDSAFAVAEADTGSRSNGAATVLSLFDRDIRTPARAHGRAAGDLGREDGSLEHLE